jgi:hypothetical protein
MDDLERLFGTLVEALEQEDPLRLRTPFQISELYQSIIPYRSFRRQLQFDTNQDYEMALLRLLSGEGGYVTVEPDEVQQQLGDEVQSINPTPGLFRDFAAARVQLNPDAVRTVQHSSASYAPPPTKRSPSIEETASRYSPPPQPAPGKPTFEPVPEPAAETEQSGTPTDGARPTVSPRCHQCSEVLPGSRHITFCPFCGNRVGVIQCAKCGSEIEAGWRFCATCGAAANNDLRSK